MQRTAIAFVVVRQKLCFVSRDVDTDGAIALAAFTREAKVERFFDGFALPTVFDDIALGHFPEQVCAAASGMLFVARDAEARAHNSTFIAAAFADSHAAQRGRRQAAMVLGKFEMGFGLPRIVVGAEAEIFVQAIGFDELARIHLPIGIPQRLKLAEGLHNFRPKLSGKKFGSRLAVSMFAGKRTAVADYEIGSLFHKLAEPANALDRFEIVIHARVDASVAEVSIE